MSEKRRTSKQSSAALKQQIISQIERGEISVAQAQKRYDIGSSITIDRGLESYGKHHFLASDVRFEMAEERDRIKALVMSIF